MQALPCRHSTKLMIFSDSHMPDAIHLLKTGRRRPNRLSHVAVQTGILLSIRRGWPLRGKAGLPMGTRSGDIDAGILEYLMNKHGMNIEPSIRRPDSLLRFVYFRQCDITCKYATKNSVSHTDLPHAPFRAIKQPIPGCNTARSAPQNGTFSSLTQSFWQLTVCQYVIKPNRWRRI